MRRGCKYVRERRIKRTQEEEEGDKAKNRKRDHSRAKTCKEKRKKTITKPNKYKNQRPESVKGVKERTLERSEIENDLKKKLKSGQPVNIRKKKHLQRREKKKQKPKKKVNTG